MALPLVGDTFEVGRRGMLPFLEDRWRREGDVFRLHVGPRRMVVVVHPDGVEHVLARHRDRYVKGRTYDSMRLLTGEGLLTLEGDAWLRRRRLEQPAFHRESIRKLVRAMVDVTARRLERMRERAPRQGTFEAHRAMMEIALEIVGETLFGQKLGDENTDASASAFKEALELISLRANAAIALPLAVPTPGNLRLKRALRLLDGMVRTIISTARGRSEPETSPTLLSMLLAARDADTGEPLTDVELRNEVITLFLAGHETTALALTWSFTLLGRHPDVVEAARAEIDAVLQGRAPTAEDLPKLSYLRQVIDEVLRLRGPTWTVARDATAPDTIGGVAIKPGDVVMPVSWLTHRHPAFWDRPEVFDPQRFAPDRVKARHPWSYYPFSLGPRMCIGNLFSLAEAQVVLAMMLQRMELEPEPSVANVQPVAQITLRPSGPVNVAFRWRQ